MTSQGKNLISAAAAIIIASVVVLGFGVDFFFWIDDPESSQSATTTAMVTSVIDGDTFEVQVGSTTESVRLIGIDAPEITWPNEENDLEEPEAECYAWEARDELMRFVADEQVQLVSDRHQPIYDDYGRRLAYVYAEDTFVNKALLAGGFAYEMSVGPGYEKQEDFRRAADDAMDSYSGLWAACQ